MWPPRVPPLPPGRGRGGTFSWIVWPCRLAISRLKLCKAKRYIIYCPVCTYNSFECAAIHIQFHHRVEGGLEPLTKEEEEEEEHQGPVLGLFQRQNTQLWAGKDTLFIAFCGIPGHILPYFEEIRPLFQFLRQKMGGHFPRFSWTPTLFWLGPKKCHYRGQCVHGQPWFRRLKPAKLGDIQHIVQKY